MPALLSFVVAGTGVALVPSSARRHAVPGLVFRRLNGIGEGHRVELLAAWRVDDQSAQVVAW